MPDPTPWTQPGLPLREARRRFYAAFDIGDDGDFDAPYQEAAFGPIRYRVPNGPWRARVLAHHDLHHLATGYRADWRGESEISAWEVGAGLGPLSYGWVIALWGLFIGLIALPGDTLAAYARGRRSRTLYTSPSAADAPTVGALTAALGVPAAVRPGVSDVVGLIAWGVVAALAGAAFLVPALGFALAATPCPFACPAAARAA